MATGKSLMIRRMASLHAHVNESAVHLPGPTASEILEKWPGLAFDYRIYVLYKHFTLLGTLIIFTKKCDCFIAGSFFIYTSSHAVLNLFDFFLLISLNHVNPIVVTHYSFRWPSYLPLSNMDPPDPWYPLVEEAH